jgi:uncharacterized membrane protein YtjA (UPF0391 family)
MSSYPEVPEWMYLIVLVIAAVLGMVGIGVYPTNVTPAVVVFGIIMPLICIIPCGLVQAVTGMPIPLNVIAEFIGGAFYPGSEYWSFRLIREGLETFGNRWPSNGSPPSPAFLLPPAHSASFFQH